MDIIIVVIAAVLIFSKEIHLTKKRSHFRPKSQYAGALFLVLTFADWYLSQHIPVESLWIMTSVLFAVMFIAIFVFSSPRDAQSSVGASSHSGNKAINIITWALVGSIGLAALYVGVSYYLDSPSVPPELSAINLHEN